MHDRQLLARHLGAGNPEHETVSYLDRIFGADRRGFVAVAHGTGPHVDSRGKYRHRRWSERFVAWPDGLEQLVKWARSASASGDVYLCPALRVNRSRANRLTDPDDDERTDQPGARPSGWAWCDCDGEWTVEHEGLYGRLTARGAFTVLSGTGRHLYVPLEPDVDQDGLESANRGLVSLFDGDAKWSGNSLLRLPGTYSWKAWARDGEPPTPVVFA